MQLFHQLQDIYILSHKLHLDLLSHKLDLEALLHITPAETLVSLCVCWKANFHKTPVVLQKLEEIASLMEDKFVLRVWIGACEVARNGQYDFMGSGAVVPDELW